MAGGEGKQSGEPRALRRRDRDDSPQGREAYGRDAYSGPVGGGAYRGVGPQSARGSNEEVLREVGRRLADDPYLDASGIEITLDGGELLLAGAVDSELAKRRAEENTRAAAGRARVRNVLRVGSMGGTTTGPAAVAGASSRGGRGQGTE